MASADGTRKGSGVEPKWDQVRCPKFHPLVRSNMQGMGWQCDMMKQLSQESATKARFGLREGDSWFCLATADTTFSHRCSICDFDLCEDCYARADGALREMREVAKEMRKERKVQWMQSKLMVVGAGRAGKTSVVRSMLGLQFSEQVDSTVGAKLTYVSAKSEGSWESSHQATGRDYAFHAAVQEMKAPGGENQALGRQIMAKLLKNKEKGLADISGSGSGNAAAFQLGGGRRSGAVKLEGEEEKVSTEDMEEVMGDVARVMGEMKVELKDQGLSELKSVKFTIWDYGGQSVFHSLHHLFLTQYGVYLVVFNLNALANAEEETLPVIQFWLQSIKLHAPKAPVFLVGTHSDLLESHGIGMLEHLNQKMENSIQGFESQIVHHRLRLVDLLFFPMSNKSQVGIKALRESIQSTSRGLDFLHLKVSISWLRVLDKVLAQADKRPWIERKVLTSIASDVGIRVESEVEAMLKLFHQLGAWIHFTYTTLLGNVIITHPQFLLQEISKVIRDPSIHMRDTTDIERCGLKGDLERLRFSALASRDLLEYFWGSDTAVFFIDLMRHTLLMSDWPLEEKNQKLYLVPSLLDDTDAASEWTGGALVQFHFLESGLPEGVFSRIVCLCFEVFKSSNLDSKACEIAKSFVVLRSTDGSFMHLSQQGKELHLTSSSPDRAERDAMCIESMLNKVNQDLMGSGLKWEQFYLDEATDTIVSKDMAKRDQLSPWFAPTRKLQGKPPPLHADLDEFVKALA